MTIIPFNPAPGKSPPFQTIVTMDGKGYRCTVTWNFYGQRWYMALSDNSGNVVWMGAMVGSPLGFDIYLALGIFKTSTILFRADTGNIEVNP